MVGGDKDGEPLYMAPWIRSGLCRGDKEEKRKSDNDDSNINYINTRPRFIVLTSKDENIIITKLSPFILKKWLKSTVGEVVCWWSVTDNSNPSTCYPQQQSLKLKCW